MDEMVVLDEDSAKGCVSGVDQYCCMEGMGTGAIMSRGGRGMGIGIEVDKDAGACDGTD